LSYSCVNESGGQVTLTPEVPVWIQIVNKEQRGRSHRNSFADAVAPPSQTGFRPRLEGYLSGSESPKRLFKSDPRLIVSLASSSAPGANSHQELRHTDRESEPKRPYLSTPESNVYFLIGSVRAEVQNFPINDGEPQIGIPPYMIDRDQDLGSKYRKPKLLVIFHNGSALP